MNYQIQEQIEYGINIPTLLKPEIEIIEMVVEDLEQYNSEYYSKNLDQIPEEFLTDLYEILEDIFEQIKQKLGNLSEEESSSFKEIVARYIESFGSKSKIAYKILLEHYSSVFNDETQNPTNSSVNYSRYPIKLTNILLTNRDCIEFYKACGLRVDTSRASSHSKVTDPSNEMRGSQAFVVAGRQTHYLENLVKQLLDLGLPLDRIIASLDKFRYSYIVK